MFLLITLLKMSNTLKFATVFFNVYGIHLQTKEKLFASIAQSKCSVQILSDPSDRTLADSKFGSEPQVSAILEASISNLMRNYETSRSLH